MNRNSILLLFILLLIPSIASAELIVNKYTNDFTASSPNNEQLKLCACETKVDRIIVENVGQFYADFHVEVRSTYPGRIRVMEPDFQLAPKHFQEVLIYVEDSCSVRGTNAYDVVVTNSYGRMRTIERSIRVDACQTASLDVAPIVQEVGLCDPATFEVTARNIGTFAEDYTLGFGQYEPEAEDVEFRLQPGESYAQEVTYRFACTDYGKRTVPFVLTAKSGDATTVWRDIAIANEYGYTMELPTSIDVCARTNTRIDIPVSNDAPASDVVYIDLDAPHFVTLDHGLELAPGEERNATLSVYNPTVGAYQMTVSSSDRYGGVSKQRDVTLNVANCYDPAVEIRSEPDTVMTVPATACCGAETVYVNVRNDGDRSQVFQLKVEGPSIFTLDETSVRVEPQQNINIPLRVTLPCTDEQHSAAIRVWPAGQPQVNESAEVVFNSQTQRTCRMVQIDDDEIAIKDDATVIPVIVKHTGSEGGVYTIETNSTLFTVQERNITLMPGDQRALHIVPLEDLTGQERGRYIVLPTFTIQSIDYVESVGIELEDDSLLARFLEWLGAFLASFTFCAWLVLLLALLLIAAVLLLVAIYGGYPFIPQGLGRRTLGIIKFALIAAAMLLLLSMLLMRPPGAEMRYERVADTTVSTTIELYQNTERTIDLRQYFEDPDQDILSYTVTQPSDIRAELEGSMLTLVPDHNFAGENTMVVTASDAKGGITDSPIIIINVIPIREWTFGQFIGAWCSYIVVFELILLLLVLFLIVLTIKEHRPRPFADNTLVIVPSRTQKTARKAARRARPAVGRIVARAPRAPARASTSARSRAVVPARQVEASVPARGRQVAVRAQAPVVREFRGSGQTVNIAVGQTPPPHIVSVPGMKPSEVIYIGGKTGNTVHTPYCMIARRIPRHKRVAYSSKREAVSAGLVPCKMCRPFEGGI